MGVVELSRRLAPMAGGPPTSHVVGHPHRVWHPTAATPATLDDWANPAYLPTSIRRPPRTRLPVAYGCTRSGGRVPGGRFGRPSRRRPALCDSLRARSAAPERASRRRRLAARIRGACADALSGLRHHGSPGCPPGDIAATRAPSRGLHGAESSAARALRAASHRSGFAPPGLPATPIPCMVRSACHKPRRRFPERPTRVVMWVRDRNRWGSSFASLSPGRSSG